MLKHKVELYVPANTPKQQKMVDTVFRAFCEEFGGATVNPVLGGWIDGKGKLITDKISIVYAYADCLNQVRKKFLKLLASSVRSTLEEDAILMVIDDKAEFY